jgi:hypothetical protein
MGISRDWMRPAFPDQHYTEFPKAFDAEPPGTVTTIPENPPGWQMRLVKHAGH